MSASSFRKNMTYASFQLPDPGDGNALPNTQTGTVEMTIGATAETNTLARPVRLGQILKLNAIVVGAGNRQVTITGGYDESGSTGLNLASAGAVAVLEAFKESASAYMWRLTAYDNVTGPTITVPTMSAADLTLHSTSEMNLQIGTSPNLGGLAIDDAAIANHTAETDTVGLDIYLETQDAGQTPTVARVGGLLSVKAGDGPTATGSVIAGAGGALLGTAGTGGTTTGTGVAGAGGAVTLTSGAGGPNTQAGAGAAGGAGGQVSITGAAGGATAATGAHASGAGGAVVILAGAAGTSTGVTTTNAGVGGLVSMTAGAGGIKSTGGVADGGIGGAASLVSGAGGAHTAAAAAAHGGAAGLVSITGGVGGATDGTGASNAGAGGGITLTTGTGGAATAGTGNAGAGGALAITAGPGAATTGGSDGAGGTVTITAGAGGGTTDGAGGNVTLVPGAGTGTGATGTVITTGFGRTVSTNVVEYTAETTITATEIVGTSAGDVAHADGAILVAAPGAGYILEFVSAVLFYNYDTAAYTGAGDDTVINVGPTGTQVAVSTSIAAADMWTKASDSMIQVNALAATDQVHVVNGGISLYAGSAPTQPGTAAGTVRIAVTYRRHTTGL